MPAYSRLNSVVISFYTGLHDLLVICSTLLIRAYQLLVSPLLGPRCRFYPSCSSYSLQALQTYGLFKGLLLSIKRVARCHPGNPGGIDLLPSAKIADDPAVKANTPKSTESVSTGRTVCCKRPVRPT